MPRKGISYNQVAAVANSLVAEGIEPTYKRVRDALGTGSYNTICKNMSTWKRASETKGSISEKQLLKILEMQSIQLSEQSATINNLILMLSTEMQGRVNAVKQMILAQDNFDELSRFYLIEMNACKRNVEPQGAI